MLMWCLYLSALALTRTEVLPHASKFVRRFDRFEERCAAYGEAHGFPRELLRLMRARIFRENIHLLVLARYTEDAKTYRALRRRAVKGLPAMLQMPEHSLKFKFRLLVLMLCLSVRAPRALTERIEYFNAPK